MWEEISNKVSYLSDACRTGSDMSYSAHVYAKAFPDMKQASWIKANVHMLEYIGGVPKMIVPDNTATAVNRNGIRKEREINPTYQEFAEHYNTAIIPDTVRHLEQEVFKYVECSDFALSTLLCMVIFFIFDIIYSNK